MLCEVDVEIRKSRLKVTVKVSGLGNEGRVIQAYPLFLRLYFGSCNRGDGSIHVRIFGGGRRGNTIRLRL